LKDRSFFFITMKKIKIGIQGVAAAFHDMAARNYFKNNKIELVEFRDFDSLANSTANREVDYSMMAIENSIAGSILPNYALIQDYDLHILGEEYLRISMQLMVIDGQTIDDITEVISHPMALLQCTQFLSGFPDWKLSEADDTAESAKKISESGLNGKAAIASSLAATTYGLKILAPNIETNKRNYTRFLVLGPQNENHLTASNKASIRLILEHKSGALNHALNILNKHSINLTKIQSVPIMGRPYEYAIHIDVEYINYRVFEKVVVAMETQVKELKILGIYKKGAVPVVV